MSTAEARRARARDLQARAARVAREYHSWVRRAIDGAPDGAPGVELVLPPYDDPLARAADVGYAVAAWVGRELGHAVTWDRARPLRLDVRWQRPAGLPGTSPPAPAVSSAPAAIRPAALGTVSPGLASAPAPLAKAGAARSPGGGGSSFAERMRRIEARHK